MNRPKTILEGAVKNKRVASAYLFVGEGALKTETASDFAHILGCKKQDIFTLSPQGTTLKIDQIRELASWVRYGPSASEYLLAVVQDADKMTAEASAAFLKTLEEPAPGVVFVLLAEREEKLLDTIRSRCQKIIFSEEVKPWQPREEYQALCSEFENAARKSMLELLGLSSQLSKYKEQLEEMLYELVNYFQYKLAKPKLARIVLDSIRSLQKRSNVKLTLDAMCLRLAHRSFSEGGLAQS